MIKEISSKDNAQVKRWLSLQENRGILKHHQYLASGQKIVRELLQSSDKESELILHHKHDAPSDFAGKIYRVSNEIFKNLDIFGTQSPLFVGSFPKAKNWDSAQDEVGLHVICPLGDPTNLGALIRSATALLCKSIILTQESANPFLPKAIRSSVGTVFRAPIKLGPSIQEVLNSPPKAALALDLRGENIFTYLWPEKCYLVIGEEGPGLPTNNLKKVTIPMSSNVESLNAVVAGSIAMSMYNLRMS
ncbi:MAG: RNA methyltransferase [Bdellovibrionales bacterium]|nr:RNA methyltransferase [Bdellovibrionales bacterium]